MANRGELQREEQLAVRRLEQRGNATAFSTSHSILQAVDNAAGSSLEAHASHLISRVPGVCLLTGRMQRLGQCACRSEFCFNEPRASMGGLMSRFHKPYYHEARASRHSSRPSEACEGHV